METDQVTLLIKDWVAIAAGLSGVTLGIYNFMRARSESNSRKTQEKRDWDFYVSVVKSNGGHSAKIFHTPVLGSAEHEIFERRYQRPGRAKCSWWFDNVYYSVAANKHS